MRAGGAVTGRSTRRRAAAAVDPELRRRGRRTSMRRAGLDPGAQDECGLAAGERRVGEPAGRRAEARPGVRHPERDDQRVAVVDRTSDDLGRERPDPGHRELGERARAPTTASADRHEDRPVDLRAGRVAQPDRVAPLAQADVERNRRAAARAGVGEAGRRGRVGGIGRRSGHVPAIGERRMLAAYQRSVAATSASTSAVVRARTIAPSAPASRQRSQVARGIRHHGLSAMSASPSQSPWNPT